MENQEAITSIEFLPISEVEDYVPKSANVNVSNSLQDSYYDFSYKIIIVGNSGVGKSSLIKKISKNEYDEDYSTTVGFEFSSLLFKINKEKVVKLQIWDTCGQEIYRSLVSNFYKNTCIAIIMYSIDDKKSFEDLDFWVNDISEKSDQNICLFLVGNKCDLDEARQVSYEEAQNFAKKNDIKYFFECSNKNDSNVKELFKEAAKYLYIDYNNRKDDSVLSDNASYRYDADETIRKTHKLKDDDYNDKKKKCC